MYILFNYSFSLTLVDTLDTLVVNIFQLYYRKFIKIIIISSSTYKRAICLCSQVLGDLEEFENAVRLVTKDVTFNTDVIVSLFETNIRMLGYENTSMLSL